MLEDDWRKLADILAADGYESAYSKRNHLTWAILMVQFPLILLSLIIALVNPEEGILMGYILWSVVGTIGSYLYYPVFVKRNYRKAWKRKLDSKYSVPTDIALEHQDGRLRRILDEVVLDVPCRKITKVEIRNGFALFYGAVELSIFFPQRGITEDQIGLILKDCDIDTGRHV